MSALLSIPLLPATTAAALGAMAFGAGAIVGVMVTTLLAAAGALLALASLGRRRLVWWCATAAAVAVGAHALVPISLVPPGLLAFDVPRAALARPIELLVPSPESALLLGIVLGERGSVPADLSLAFARSGTTHLLAISGFNMTLVATAVSLALRGRAAPPVRAAVAVSAIVLYSLLVGLSPSVLRAALMAAVAAVGVVSGRRAATANGLCAAIVAMLVADPSAVSDVGLQLSALATAGLVLWQSPVASRLDRLPGALREGIATTVAATLPTIPVVAATFGRVSVVSIVANLVCVPLFPPLMLAGAATSLAGAASLDAARPVALLAFGVAAALRGAVTTFASLPLAALDVPSGPLTAVAVTGLEVAAVWCVRGLLHRAKVAGGVRRGTLLGQALRSGTLPQLAPPRWAARRGLAHGLVVAAAAAPAALLVAWPSPPPVARVTALDIGQGDAYLVEAGDAVMLVDGGPDPARLLDELGATLGPWRRRIDVVALTHAHTDHGAGLLAVLDRYEVGLAIEPRGLNPGPLTDLWSKAIASRGVVRRAVQMGERFSIGDLRVTVLAPDPDLRVDVPSLVLHVERGAFSVLFTGDAVDDALARLLEHPRALRSRVYVPPHHGAETPHAAALRLAAHPDVALISVGAGNRYGHPTAPTLAALAGLALYRTDHDGSVEISLDGTGLVARTHANGLPPPRRGSIPYSAPRQ
ncbi:MAG TPA: ComEC/Rec2 family competence protein [Candidatus Limnocylindria bacterium]|nr:ComEC/Rec2 family competence protein [Candidatus Limnocylindria bacterium]